MNRFYILLIAVLFGLHSNAQSVFYEDFENGITSQFVQTNVVGVLNWVTDPNAVALGPSSEMFEGDSSAHFYASGYTGDITTLTTPSLDLSAGGYRLSFAHVQPNWVGDQNTLSIYHSGDDGATWTLIDSIGSDIQDYVEVEYALDNFVTTTATSKIRFSGWIDYGYSIGLDVVNIFLPEANDAELTSIVSPTNGCGLGSETVTIEVYNNGLDPIQSIDASYEVNNVVVTETFTTSILSGQSGMLSFTTPLDLSVPGTYNITAWTNLNEDANMINDTVSEAVESIPVISTLPYLEDFENGAGGWTSAGVFNTWELGAPATTFINAANSGINAWVTNLDGTYENGTDAYVESPCFDLSSLLIDPVFRFAFITNSEVNYDGTWIEVSTDAGTTWNTVGNVGEGTNWYTNADEHGANFDLDWWDAPFGGAGVWTTATHLLTGAAGSSSVKVRVFFHSDGSVNAGFDGFAFDDVQIYEQPSINAGVTEILSPITGCGLGTELVTVVIENFGDADLVDFNIEYNAGNGIITELYADTLFAATVDTFTFAVPLDLSATGTYQFGAWTAVVGDGDLTSDSAFSTISSIPVIASLPYMIDFESGDGGWTSGGVLNSWELGDPETAFIDTAHSGINAWVTNLDGTYENGTDAYVESPCFDFSSLVIDPVFRFALIANSEVGWDGTWIEVSTDAGATWNTVGNFGEGTNWYTNEDEHGVNFDEDWWDEPFSEPGVWVTATHLLDGTAGSGSVKVRVFFHSDGSINEGYDGFAFDDVEIFEQPPINATVFAVTGPVSSCGLSTAETVSVTISNIGSIDLDSLVVSYSLNNGPVETQVFDEVLVTGNSTNVSFASTIDLSVVGDYELVVWVDADGDGDHTNDTLSVIITSVPTISDMPYFQDFEAGNGGWSSVGVELAWELGDPEGAFIDTAFSGVNAWATNLNQLNYENGEYSILLSPCFDLSNLTEDPVISFAIIHESEVGWDGAWMEVSTDGGTTWARLGNTGEGENWYTNTDFFNGFIDQAWDGESGNGIEWVNAEHILEGVAGSSNVRVRFVFSSDLSVNFYEGFAIDDISIHPQAQLDLVSLSIEGPEDNCSLGEEQVSFKFWNKGLQTVSNFPVGFRADGGVAQYETYTGSVAQFDTVTYTFTTQLADLSAIGLHTIDVFTALAGDEYTDSDSLFGFIVENHGDLSPMTITEAPGAIISAELLQGTTSQMFFCGLPNVLDGCLQIASVTIDSIEHTWLSDLSIYLISPAGDSVELSTGNGGSGDNMSNVIFTDASTNDITLQVADIIPGEYHTQDPLGFEGLYDGQNPNGAWSLYIADLFGGDDGVLISWTMSFINNNPMPVINASDTTICLTQVLNVGVDQYDSYLWSNGGNTQNINLSGSVLGLGAHEIHVTVDNNGCTGISNSFILTVDACAGVEELGNLTIETYPNPTNGELILAISGESSGLNISLTDMHGKVVFITSTGAIRSGLRRSIDLSSLANGMYFMKLDDGTAATTRKVIKQ